MKKENILRIHRKEILDNFIISFYSTDNSISSYCKANLPQIWTKNTAKYQVQKITESDYEETLIKYFQSPFIEQNEQPLLVLVGGIGAGKSASVRYSLSNSNICEGCLFSEECAKNYPDRILVDFINFKTSVITSTPENVQKKRAISLYNNFWYHIIKILDEVINCEMDSKTEISMFWNWLMSTQSNAIPIEIYKLLFPKKDRFSDYSANSAELYELKEMIYEKLDVKGLAHYKLFQIAFLRVKKSSNCNFVIFDNIDTLAPYLQAELINFTLEAHRLLNCKAVIPIRPHTLTTNKDASDFFEIIEHWKPSLNTVFKKRLENFEKNGNPEVYYALDQLIKLIKSSNVFTDLFIATSGG